VTSAEDAMYAEGVTYASNVTSAEDVTSVKSVMYAGDAGDVALAFLVMLLFPS